jgi:hypothetical protein
MTFVHISHYALEIHGGHFRLGYPEKKSGKIEGVKIFQNPKNLHN